MRSAIPALLVLAAAWNPSPARAGEGGSGVGNGGAIWTCRSEGPGRELIWAELLDLSEARREFGLKIVRDTPFDREDWIRMAERKIEQADPAYFAAYSERMRQVRDEFRLVEDSELNSTRDFYDRTRPDPRSCPEGTIPAEPEQLANFTHQGHLIVNAAIWNSTALVEIDRGALYVHEAIYKLLRETEGATDSAKTRELVGYLFSDKPVSQYAHLLRLAKSARPLEGIRPAALLGNYVATGGDWADITLSHWDSARGLLYLSENDRDNGGKEMNAHVFKCKAQGKDFRCEMTSTTNRLIRWFRGVNKHRLLFTEESGFVWLNQRPSGTIRATRYRALRKAVGSRP